MQVPEPYLVWKEEQEGGAHAPAASVLSQSALQRWLRFGALLTLLFIALPPFPMLLAPLWLVALVTGYGAAVLIALLMLLPLRRLVGWPDVRLSVPRHQRLAEWALALTVLHVAVFLIEDGMMIEYLLPSQPRYMAAGNIGGILLLLLVVTSLERPRVALFGPRLRFRTVHVGASIVLVLLVAAHMIGSEVYVAGPWKAALCALISAGLIAATLKPPKPRAAGDSAAADAGARDEVHAR